MEIAVLDDFCHILFFFFLFNDVSQHDQNIYIGIVEKENDENPSSKKVAQGGGGVVDLVDFCYFG